MKKLNFNQGWKMKELSGNAWYPVTLPASVMNTLLDAEVIDDPFYRDNEEKALEVAQKDYIFQKEFEIKKGELEYDHFEFIFHGVDTIADIFLNGHKISNTDNMHRIFEISVKDYLKEGTNILKVILYSPIRYIESMHEKDPLAGVDHAIQGYQHLRKSHSMFGWDWGPKIPDLGIWRDVELVMWNDNRIDDVYIAQNHEENHVQLDVKVTLHNQKNTNLRLSAKVISPGGIEEEQVINQLNQLEHLSFLIQDPQLWWPAGYGEQPLYKVEISLLNGEKQLDRKNYTVGLRTIEVKHEKDKWGKSFEFVVNGYPIFMKGANYIPEDSLLPRTTKARTEQLIKDCKAANFNMIRVWGGGHYPEDYFYDLCDQHGLIVWQDFMFACSVYRLTEHFTQNVQNEAIDQIKRIRHHASLGIWCGNNEVEEAMEHWGWPKKAEWRRDYIKLFEIMLPEVVMEYDPQTFYWSSSPSSGGGFDEPKNPDIGDVHYWEVWHGQKPFNEYRNYYFRFCSEFGFQSFPSLKTIESFTEPGDRNIFSRIMEKHQKNDDANGKILYYLSENFLYPKDFDTLLYTSQLLQAEAIKYGVEHWRRNLGRCMGSLYWQLNDCWPVASWSSIDYFGRWKALHYFARKFYDPVLVSLEEGEKNTNIYVTNDHLTEVKCRVEWKLRNNKSVILEHGDVETVIPSLTAVNCQELDFSSVLTAERKRNCYLEAILYINEEWYSSTTVIFTKAKHFEFLNPHLTSHVSENNEQIMIEILANAYTKYVEIQLDPDVILSDNYFDLSANEPKIVTIDKSVLPETITLKDIEESLKLRSVYHITHESQLETADISNG
ncbi:beta-mannosidase [Gracilibacillus ureilyticus]|uniref:Beta-mannosidase n=1 Tax=Gracilibacillus ureilyticus TaxID=531814 RepID=A0A1H9PN32_9BACI|nr:glycoside hydrolase family 2 protein [Gracilibacillus ureilyticus]SER49235.1 beta-mannosidase [Gracilibacillus ureilyticus]